MFISKGKISKGDIASFKLVNGEELAGKVAEVTNDYYVIERPVVAHLTQQGVAPFPAIMTGDASSIELYKRNILYSCPSTPEFSNVYLQATTGIAQVPAGTIVR